MAGKRSYGDPCGIARALDVLGERWALLVVRELVLGPKRFTDLRRDLSGIATDILAQRLRQLEQAGVLHQVPLPPPAAGQAYALTERGRELEPVLHALGRWGSREPFVDIRHDMSVDAFAVALSTVFDPDRAAGLEIRLALVVDGDALVAEIRESALTIRRGTAEDPDAGLGGPIAVLREVLWRDHPLADAESDGVVEISGERQLVERFVRLFPPPS